MKQLLTSLLMTLVLGTSASMAQNEEEGLYTLKNGNLTMTINAAKGAKILSFKCGDQEVISQLKWPESFGGTFWTSPQKEWNWPPVFEFDKKPYTVEEKDGVITMTSEVSEKLKFRVRKSFKAEGEGIAITYSIINEGDETKKVAPWEITRVLNDGGLIFFEAPSDSIWPIGLMNFKNNFGAAWYQADATNENRKINADGQGWLAYYSNGLLLVKCFENLSPSQPAPNEAEIQVYVNRGKTFIELESQGAYTTLQPKEALNWTVRWYLQPYNEGSEPSEGLLNLAKNIVKKAKGQCAKKCCKH